MNQEQELNDDGIAQSTAELMSKCYRASCDIAFDENWISTRPRPECVSDALWDEIWCWVDGLYQKGFFNRMNNRSSLKAFLEFNIEEEEKYMQDYLKRILFVPRK